MFLCVFILCLNVLAKFQCRSQLQFHDGVYSLPNNSFYLYEDVGSGDYSLKCMTDNETCCNNTNVGNWIDHKGRSVKQGEDGGFCLYVTRGEREISLNRRNSCTISSGIWRCDIPDSSGEIQSLYIYLGNANPLDPPPYEGQLNPLVIMNFTLLTDPRASVPEFTVSCLTRGGPATTVQWTVNGVSVEEDRDHETSQIILDTSHNSVYDNRLRVRGRRYGTYNCSISNNIKNQLPTANLTKVNVSKLIQATREPDYINATIFEYNTTHYSITLLWTSPLKLSCSTLSQSNQTNYMHTTTMCPVIDMPEDPTKYIIYYQSKGEEVNSAIVSGGETETHSLDGLQRGLTYNISIVALSDHLPSHPIGPFTIEPFPLVVVETSPESLNVTANTQFSITCTARADVKFYWIRIHTFNLSVETEVDHSLYTTTGSPERGYQSVLTTSENDTLNYTIYRCIANTSDYFIFSETTVFIVEEPTSLTPSHGAIDGEPTSEFDSGSGSSGNDGSGSGEDVTYSLIPSTTNMAETTFFPSKAIMSTSTLSPSSISISISSNDNGKDEDDRELNNDDKGSNVSAIVIPIILAIVLFSIVGFTFLCLQLRKRAGVPRSKLGRLYNERPPWLETYELRGVVWREEEDEGGVDNHPPDDREALLTVDISVRNNIPVNEFPDYVLEMAKESKYKCSKLATEYQQFDKMPSLSYEVACHEDNEDFNRFRNIYPYDDSRVPLSKIPDEPGSDYINASFISGYDVNKYIAAQAPMGETMSHFWRMVWEYKMEAIVMLTRCVEMGREKSTQYWPESLDETITAGDNLTVTLSSSTPYAEYHIRKFIVKHSKHEGESMIVTQFHYTVWPDHGVPDNVMSIIRFIRHVRKLFPLSRDPPLLVHCSAGVGRTGTFITLDMMMQQMKNEGTLSVYQCVRDLRTQRMKMVQTLAQYEFIHHALSELVVCGETEVAASSLRSFLDSLRDPATTDSHLTLAQQHIEALDDLSQQQDYDYTEANDKTNINKNRDQNKLPNEVYRVPVVTSSGSDYINASFINGYKQRHAYIVTQGPLENTVEDFWRMMWEYQCGCVVMLCQLVEDGQESSYCYWPSNEGEEMMCGEIKVKLVRVKGHGDIIQRRIEVTEVKLGTEDKLLVKIIQLISWPVQGLPHPSAIMSLIELFNNVLMTLSSKQSVIMCRDGVVRSGTFLCIHSQLERLKTEGTVDVFQAIKSARIQRPGIIPNTDHYIFCYEVLADYVEKMDTYNNFKTLM